MTEDLQFLEGDKDTSRSCVFDYPDRPVDSLPPNYPTVDPPPGFPYEPVLDWPFITPRPDPDPVPDVPLTDLPPTNPSNGTPFNELIPYFYTGEDQDPQFGGGTGGFYSSGPGGVLNISFAIVGHILYANRFAARDAAGPILLDETGHNMNEAGPGNSVSTHSGLFAYTFSDLPGNRFLQYFAYYACFFDGMTGEHKISFAPVGFTRINPATAGCIVGMADFSIGPANLLPTIGFPPAQTLVSKTINTLCILLYNGNFSYSDEINIP